MYNQKLCAVLCYNEKQLALRKRSSYLTVGLALVLSGELRTDPGKIHNVVLNCMNWYIRVVQRCQIHVVFQAWSRAQCRLQYQPVRLQCNITAANPESHCRRMVHAEVFTNASSAWKGTERWVWCIRWRKEECEFVPFFESATLIYIWNHQFPLYGQTKEKTKCSSCWAALGNRSANSSEGESWNAVRGYRR